MRAPCQIHIRRASASEIAEIMRQRKEMFRDMGFHDSRALFAMQLTSEQFLKKAFAEGCCQQWFAETRATQILGGVAVLAHPWVSNPADPRPQKAYILNLYVDPNFRGIGVARKLMETAIEWSRQHGFRSVYLHASQMGEPLYQKLGFNPTNEMRLDFLETQCKNEPRD